MEMGGGGGMKMGQRRGQVTPVSSREDMGLSLPWVRAPPMSTPCHWRVRKQSEVRVELETQM